MSKFKKFADGVSAEELDRAFGKKFEKKESKVFQPGEHEVKIVSVEDEGVTRFDDKWLNYKITFEGLNGRTCRAWLAIPTDSRLSPGLDGSYPLSTFKKFVRFCEALGIEGTQTSDDATYQTLETYFGNTSRLVGLHLKLKIGYKGTHAESVKNEEGKYEFRLVDRLNNPITENLFPNRDAIDAYVMQNKLEKQFKSFPEIISYHASSTKNNLSNIIPSKKIGSKVAIPGFE